MNVLFALGFLVISIAAVRLPTGLSDPSLSAVQNSGSYSPVTFVVVPRQAGPYYPNLNSEGGLENSFGQLYQDESRKSTPSVKTKRVITLDDRFRNPYAIPKRKLNYRQTENAQAQFLKEVTPTTMTAFEEQQQQDVPAFRFTETPTVQTAELEEEVVEGVENEEAQITQPETNEQSRLPLVDVQNLDQIRPFVFVQPGFNAMQFFQQQVQSQDGLLNAQSEDTNQGVSSFVPSYSARFPKPTEAPKKAPKKNQRPQVFPPRVNEENEEVASKPVPVQPRLYSVLRQANAYAQSPRLQFANFEFGNGQTQAYNKRFPQNYKQLPQIVRELPFRYRLQLDQYNGKQEPQLLQFPPYFGQAQLGGGLPAENANVEEDKASETPVRQPINLNKRKYRPVKILQEKNVERSGNTRVEFQPQLFYPNYRYKLYPYATYQYLPKNKQRTIQILRDEEDEQEQEQAEEQQQ